MKESDQLTLIIDELVIVQAIKEFDTVEKINALEAELLSLGSVFIPVKHVFSNGIYARQVTMPAGIIAIGHAHSDQCLNIVSSGSVSVLIDGKMKLISAPATFVSEPGDRKIGYVHDELIWTTIHATKTRDIAKAEEETIIKTKAFIEYEKALGDPSTSYISISGDEFTKDRADFIKKIGELGFSADDVRIMSENIKDQIPFPQNTGNGVYVMSSKISGNGLFSSFRFDRNTTICPALVNGKRTPAGRFTNHSCNPNCMFCVDNNGDIFLYSLNEIEKDTELTVDYKQARAASTEADRILTINTIK